jgi:hypothetical protein
MVWAVTAVVVVAVLGEQRPKLPHDVRRSTLAASHSLCLSSYHRLIVAEFRTLCVIVLEIRCAPDVYSWIVMEILDILFSENFFWGVLCTSFVFLCFAERDKSRKKEKERRHRAAVERGEITY